MSLINKIKEYFKRTESENRESEILIDGNISDTGMMAGSANDNGGICLEIDQEESLDDVKMAAIFDRVINVFNDSLPGFLKSSVDSEKQKKYLLESLEVSLKDYLRTVEEDAKNRGMAVFQNERNEQKKMIEDLKQRMLEVEKKRNDLNEQHLSDGRQKRALNERVRDLEKQVIELEADREQLQIENKSLVNKIKVAGVLEADVDAMREEINSLRANQTDSNDNEEKARLKEENQKLYDEIDALKSEISRLDDELSKRNDALQTVKMKDEMGDVMLNDLQKRASEANRSLKDAEDIIAEQAKDLALKNAQLDDYKKLSEETESRLAQALENLAAKERELASSEAKVAEAEENMEALNEIADQIESFYDIKRKMEERIAKLKDEVTGLRNENSSLKDTIQRNLITEAQQNKSYQEEIDKLREEHDNNSSWQQ